MVEAFVGGDLTGCSRKERSFLIHSPRRTFFGTVHMCQTESYGPIQFLIGVACRHCARFTSRLQAPFRCSCSGSI